MATEVQAPCLMPRTGPKAKTSDSVVGHVIRCPTQKPEQGEPTPKQTTVLQGECLDSIRAVPLGMSNEQGAMQTRGGPRNSCANAGHVLEAGCLFL